MDEFLENDEGKLGYGFTSADELEEVDLGELKQAEKELEDFKSEMWNKYVDQVQYRSEIAKLMTEEEVATADRLVADVNRLRKEWNETQDAIPAAPFEKNWHELAMKRMLRYAAENGYDKIAWTTGDQQADRYNLGRSLILSSVPASLMMVRFVTTCTIRMVSVAAYS